MSERRTTGAEDAAQASDLLVTVAETLNERLALTADCGCGKPNMSPRSTTAVHAGLAVSHRRGPQGARGSRR